jgi:MSHA biogenesis protein MshQ
VGWNRIRPASARSQSGGWYSGWGYRKEIVIQASAVSGAHSNFPVLVRRAADADLAARAQEDGDDLVFTDASGVKLDHELERFDGATGELVAWVRIASLSGAANTTIFTASSAESVGQWRFPTSAEDTATGS